MNTDPLAPPKTVGPDSFTSGLATAATSTRGRGYMRAALPYLVSVLTGVAGWAGGKLDTKLELQAALALREDIRLANQERQRDHAQAIAEIRVLRDLLLSQDVRDPGRVPRVERGVYLAFRALAEVRAASFTAETAKARAQKEFQGGRFARSFDARVQGRDPSLVYDELFAQVAVP